ncbi:hypothetical protein HY988_02935 [Candidatus Micrarchaeota archaeon]|nr:hypothetical protein [Candidatus Micrarchaeota archaeon]
MRSQIIFVLLIILAMFPLSSAFSASDYLHDGETNSSVSYSNFTLNGSFYSIVSINGAENFLLRDNQLVANSSDISMALRSYYLSVYYPSSEDINGLLSAIDSYNKSRNDGYDFKLKEEYTCRDEILFSNGKIKISGTPITCKDNATCFKNAQILFSVYGQGLNLGSPQVILQPLKDFSLSSFAMDAFLSNYTQSLQQIGPDNVISTISYMSKTAPSLSEYQSKIESTVFRTPRLNDSSDKAACQLKCWAICPSLSLDHNGLKDIQNRIQNLSTKVAPLTNYVSVSGKISNNTQARLDYVKTKSAASYYADLFGSLNKSGAESMALADNALSHVSNPPLSEKLDQLKLLDVTIPLNIAKKNFSHLDADLADYSDLTKTVSSLSTGVLSEYKNTLKAKENMDTLTLLLDSKEMDAGSIASFEIIRNQTAILDSRFTDGLTVSQLQELSLAYQNISAQETELLSGESNSPASKGIMLMRGLSRRLDVNIAKVASESKLFQPSPALSDAPVITAIFSALLFISLFSVMILFFLRISPALNSTLLKILFACCFVLLLAGIVLLYTVMLKAITNATLSEFLNDFGAIHSTSVFVDSRNTSLANSDLMARCANTLSNSLKSENKSVDLLIIYPDFCIKQNSDGSNSTLTTDQCAENFGVQNSSFFLGYSDVNVQPKFSIIYGDHAQIAGNSQYYQLCPLPSLFGASKS